MADEINPKSRREFEDRKGYRKDRTEKPFAQLPSLHRAIKQGVKYLGLAAVLAVVGGSMTSYHKFVASPRIERAKESGLKIASLDSTLDGLSQLKEYDVSNYPALGMNEEELSELGTVCNAYLMIDTEMKSGKIAERTKNIYKTHPKIESLRKNAYCAVLHELEMDGHYSDKIKASDCMNFSSYEINQRIKSDHALYNKFNAVLERTHEGCSEIANTVTGMPSILFNEISNSYDQKKSEHSKLMNDLLGRKND